MALQKQTVTLNFAQGVDTKTDPNQLPFGKFEALDNSVFDTLNRLTKRNGFPQLTSLPDRTSTYVTTFNGNLTAIGNNLRALSEGANRWVTTGPITPVTLSTLPLIHNNNSHPYADIAISTNGLICTAFTESVIVGSTSTPTYKFAVADTTTGQNILPPQNIISKDGSAVQAPRAFFLGNYFIVAFATSSASSFRLQYISINSANPQVISSATDISTSYTPSSQGSFDGVVANNSLYLSWNGASNSGIKSTVLDQNLNLASEVVIASTAATIVSVTSDNTGSTPVIWTAGYVNGTNSGVIVATNSVAGSASSLATLFSAQQFINSASPLVVNVALSARMQQARIYYEHRNHYTFGSGTASNFIQSRIVTQTGSVGTDTQVARSVGLASKPFSIGSGTFLLSSYQSQFQSTYFLISSTGTVISKLAYSNGGGYATTGLPSVFANGVYAYVPYIVKDLIQSVNKDTNVSSSTQIAGIYAQTGINLAKFNFTSQNLVTAETGNNLHLNGGMLWAYDGYVPVEHGFHLYPDSVFVQNGGSPGNVAVGNYFYRVTYEWSDNQGNLFRSAPSIPQSYTVSTTQNSISVQAPTLRLTYKTANPIKVVFYRWSQNQQVYYQASSIFSPVNNVITNDSVEFLDTNADSAILGNNVLYTEGGVVENIEPNAPKSLTLFDGRLWAIDSENPNTLTFSKQVLQSTPVEMSDLFTVFISPNAAAQGPTGPIECIAPMDDKLIIFKKNAIYYINGIGPDNTGANSQYSEPIFITGTVGCSNQNSIVLTPIGLMFQSDKGIWLLGRGLDTQYIGQDVDGFNSYTVLSSLTIPGTNQVRFTLNNGITLLYDYLVNQWGTFSGIPGISSTLYENKHTFINQYGEVYQESPGTYLDGSRPVLMSYRTGWINLAGLQGYKRIYKCYLLGNYESPHRFTFGIAYNYEPSVTQLVTVVPDNFSGNWGSGTSWGSIFAWGGSSNKEQWQINFENQQCQSFQLSFREYFDSTKGEIAGAGLTVSGMTILAGVKKSWPTNIAIKNQTG